MCTATHTDSLSFYIKTFGCQMNEYDSGRIMHLLTCAGYRQALSYHDAAVIILNTCSVRQKAEEKVYSEIGRVRSVKEARPDVIIAVGGCVAQHAGERLIKKFPFVNIVFGPHALSRLPGLLKLAYSGETVIDTELNARCDIHPRQPYEPENSQITAFIAVMSGCDNFCSYCIVPYVRGPEWSRQPEEILGEIIHLANRGVKEVTLLGQNVNSYGRTINPPMTFAQLLSDINAIDGLERIRFTTSHPKDLSDELIYCFSALDKLCEHIHLPLQSGSDRILAMMNRSYTRVQYLAKIEALRKIVPNASITSDILVGFPGETEADFAATMSIIEEICFDDLFIFHYTDRPGTKASGFNGKVVNSVKIERLMQLNDLQRKIGLMKNKKLIGTTCGVLFEDVSKKKGSGMLAGRTRTNKTVNCRASVALLGKTVPVRIEQAHIHSLTGCLIQSEG